MKTHISLDTNKLAMCLLLIGCNVTPNLQHEKRICTTTSKISIDVIMEKGNGRLAIQASKKDM